MKKIILIISLFSWQTFFSQEITLNHNIGQNIVDQLYNFHCSGASMDWARVFVLDEFDITGEFIINSGSFGVESSNWGPSGEGVIVNIYEIDNGFPETFNEANILGFSDLFDIPSYANHMIFNFAFPTPIIVSANVEMILVEVKYNSQTQTMFFGGTMDSYDYSWFKTAPSCVNNDGVYQSTYDYNRPNLNFYITVTGNHILATEDFENIKITLAPNPVRKKLMIQFPTNFRPAEMVVFDLQGRIILQCDVVDELDVSDIPSGLYFLKIKTKDGFITEKFIKE